MSLTPGTEFAVSRRRRWLVPLAVASTVLLGLTGVGILAFAVQGATPSHAAVEENARAAPRVGSDPPPPAVPLPDGLRAAPTAEAPAPAAPALGASGGRSTATKSSTALSTAPARTSAAPGRKPAPAPSSRRDLYRPF